jgi:hypothetical protein
MLHETMTKNIIVQTYTVYFFLYEGTSLEQAKNKFSEVI